MRHCKLIVLVVCIEVIAVFCCTSSVFGQAKPVSLNYTTHMPPKHGLTVMATEWAQEIEKRTQGKVKFTIMSGGTLLAADKAYDGIVKGIADVGLAVPGFTKGRFPLSEVLDLPLGYKSATAATKLANIYYNRFKPKEFGEVQVMYVHAHGPGVLHSKKAVSKLEELKGMKIRCTGLSAKVAAAIGGTPVAMPVGESYDALSRGVVDASFASMEAAQGWKWAEVTKFIIESSAIGYTTSCFMFMNKKIWNSLDPETQKIIQKVNEEWVGREADDWEKMEKAGREYALKMGNKIMPFSKEEDERVAKAVRPLLDDYVAAMKKNGLPGDEVLKFCLDELKKLR
ncbi:MAG: TRAP transporter substrate-binding protein [candidate division WOR-3 bacterium]